MSRHTSRENQRAYVTAGKRALRMRKNQFFYPQFFSDKKVVSFPKMVLGYHIHMN